ncbi:hypothetical protein [Kitasatospora sp. NPDC057015]|uniref:hypothetical protein n=1 Tax=Kitasatospora sp. NPDC057015 TaxID=3346001 RepID=UPI00362E4210
MNDDEGTEITAAARRARFARLPDRIRFEDMTEVRDVSEHGEANPYNPERSWTFYSCLPLDLGL